MRSPRTARNRVVELAFNEPIIVGDIPVSPGDYVIADGSAVIFIEGSDIERVLAVAEGIAAREAAMTKALLAGRPVSQVIGADYEHLLRGEPSYAG